MLRRRLLPAVALIVACLAAFAPTRAGAETLVLVSPPPALDAAVRASLAPWRVKIIVVQLASGTPAELALALGAGFVVWADQGELVLWDARAGVGERRDIPAELDDANAAALALSIKTWMRLGAPVSTTDENPSDESGAGPPPPAGSDVAVLVPVSPAPAPPRLRVEASMGARSNISADGRASLRASFGVVARTGPVDLVMGLELGPAQDTTTSVASGEVSTVAVGAHARLPVSLTPALTVSPGAGLVLARSSFSGTDDMARAFAASAHAPGLDAAGLVEWRPSRLGRLVVAAEIGVTYVLTSQELRDRNMRLVTPAHIEPRGLVRVGFVLR